MTHQLPVSEYALCKPTERTKKGLKGFSKVAKPKDATFTFRLKSETNKFIEDYCAISGITKTQLILASIQCYTRYDGKNGRQIIKEMKDTSSELELKLKEEKEKLVEQNKKMTFARA